MTADARIWIEAGTALIVGAALGAFHFATLARVTNMLMDGRLTAVFLQVGRFAIMAAALWIAARQGAPVLLAGAIGIMAGRALILRRAR